MKHKILITTLIAIGFSLSGASHALSVLKPDGTRSVANVEGNKLMLLATSHTERSQSPGHFALELDKPTKGVIAPIDNKANKGVIAPIDNKANKGVIAPIDNKAKAGIIGPMNPGPGKLLPAVQPSTPGMGSPAATQGGLLMQKNKPGNEVAPGSPGYKASTLGGQGPTSVQTTPMPQGTQSRASSKSPKGPSGPEGSVPPSQ